MIIQLTEIERLQLQNLQLQRQLIESQEQTWMMSIKVRTGADLNDYVVNAQTGECKRKAAVEAVGKAK